MASGAKRRNHGSLSVSIGAAVGVAFRAHIGGFIAGMVLIRLFSGRDYLEEHRLASLASAADRLEAFALRMIFGFRLARQPPTVVTWAELHFYDLPVIRPSGFVNSGALGGTFLVPDPFCWAGREKGGVV